MERKKATDFPQALLDEYHLFIHGEIDRRAFMERARKYAVGGLTVAGIMAGLEPNFAWAQQVKTDDPRIIAETATVSSPRGHMSIKGHFARPRAAGKYPAVLVIHENRGLNPYIEDVARRLATENFIAFAPDGLTSVGGYPGNEDQGRAMFAGVDRAKMTEDFIAAAAWLKARPESNGKYGVVGFCFGGAQANLLATRLPDLGAAVPFYGAAAPAAEIPKIKAAIQVHHGQLDTGLAAGWPAYDAALTAAGVTHEGFIYPNANHGFHNDTTPRYDEAAAKLAWQRTIGWFNKHLRS
jgi:carboxymethylenebutenolidase